VTRRLARDLISAQSVRFDASDSMPQVMESAFNNAVLEYLDSPRQLNVILQGLDQVRKAAYQAAASRCLDGSHSTGWRARGSMCT
jgi:alpha-glucoside transport system substrate-binding protein